MLPKLQIGQYSIYHAITKRRWIMIEGIIDTKEEVAELTVLSLRIYLKKPWITVKTKLGDFGQKDALGLPEVGKRMLYFPLRESFASYGVRFKKFSPTKAAKCKVVQDLADAIVKDLGIK
jgi:hypothetical protein